MNIITAEDLNNEISILAKDTKNAIDHIKSLHRREKDIKCRKLTRDWAECFLDLYQLRHYEIDYDNDPAYLKLCQIRDNFIKLMR